jgi:hypothetical protein
VHSYLYSIIPFLALLTINILLIYHSKASRSRLNVVAVATTVSSQTVQKKNEIKSMGMTIILLTFVFLLATLPRSILVAFFLDLMAQDRLIFYITRLFDSISTAYHSFSFFVLLVTNKQIMSECKQIFYYKLSNSGIAKRARTKSLAVSSINTFQ